MKTFKKLGVGTYSVVYNEVAIGRVYKNHFGLWISKIGGEERNATTLKLLKQYINA